MSIQIRPYDHTRDYDRVGKFLLETYQAGDVFINWLQPRWEYMHHHTLIRNLDLKKIGIVEEGQKLIGAVHFEHHEGQVYFQVHPDYGHVKEAMIEYACRTFREKSTKDGRVYLALFVNETDSELEALAEERGFAKWQDSSEEHSRMVLDRPVPEISLPHGFSLKSLADENDFHKINRVLWRGFNHEGPPPEEEVQSRREMQRAPNFCKELNIVAVAPEGHFVSYSGIWYVEANRIAYVEPVATDPDYRRMGLGKAVVLECIRRVMTLGAKVAWVGSGLAFYKAIGFEKTFDVYPWVKYFPEEGFGQDGIKVPAE
jgi:predicted N-acetyltransferase YhbS